MELQDRNCGKEQNEEQFSILNKRLISIDRRLEFHDIQHAKSEEIWTGIIAKLHAVEERVDRGNRRIDSLERDVRLIRRNILNFQQEPTGDPEGQSGIRERSNAGCEIELRNNSDVPAGSSVPSDNGK